MYGRFVVGLPGFLRQQTITVDEAKAAVGRDLAARDANFLTIVRRGIFGHARSPYLPLLKLAGCEFGDIESAVRRKGLEASLEDLRNAGVYFTFEEYKGRRPVVRGGVTLDVDEHDFDSPLTREALEGRTGGSTGASARVSTDLDDIEAQVPILMLVRWGHGLLGIPSALWKGAPPDPVGLGIYLRAARWRGQPVRWFTPVTREMHRPALRFRLATEYVLAVSRLCGVPCPRPEPLPLAEAVVLARWAADAIRTHGGCEIVCTVSLAVRICTAAREEGIDLSGAAFYGGGEPLTEAKNTAIASVGARFVSLYISEDAGPMGIQCGTPCEVGDHHLLDHGITLIQHPREVLDSGVEVDAFYFTSLRPLASKILLNVESDDYGIVEERACGCPFGELGFRRHVRRIRSFGKLTGEGVTLVGTEMVRILEEVLPRRFGGSPQDFQLVEEEDDATGFTRLALLVHPRLEIARQQDVIDAMLGALTESSISADLGADVLAAGRHLPGQARRADVDCAGEDALDPQGRYARTGAERRRQRKERGVNGRAVMLGLCLAVPLAGCATENNQSLPPVDHVKAAVVPYLTLMPFYIAAEEGYFAEQNLDVEFVQLGRDSELMTALARGQVDVAGGMLTANELALIASGVRIRMVASLGNMAPGACTYAAFIARREHLESGALRDRERIAGLRFDANVILPFGYFIDEFLRPFALTTGDLDVIDLPSPAALAALANGSIDVTIDSEPFISQHLESREAAVWARVEDIVPNYLFTALRYGPTILDERPEVGRRFAVAMLKAIRQYNLGKTARNREIVERASGLNPERVAAACWPVTTDDARVDASVFRGYQEWNVSHGFVGRVLSDDELVAPRFFDAANTVLGSAGARR